MWSKRNTQNVILPIRLNPFVFWSSAISISLFGLLFVLFPSASQNGLTWIQQQVNQLFGWYYVLVVVLSLGFVAWLAFSKVGQIPLGKAHDRPEFGYLAWTSMLFSAGIGIALLYYGVAEPVDHFLRPPEGQGGTVEAAQNAMMYSFLHWGIHGWVLYALVGVTLGYFAFRRDLPLALRSALYPIFGERIHGLIGHMVDGFGILATIISLVTNLGIGALVLVSGICYLFPMIPNSSLTLITTVVLMMVVATMTTVVGIEKGLAWLSRVNLRLLYLLLAFVFFTGPTNHLLNGLVQNTGDYLSHFVQKSFDLYLYDKKATGWLASWTIFYWAWWIAWAPFVGMFIARISKGRTIREVVLGVCLIPLGFTLAWISIFGNTAIDLILNQGQGILGTLVLKDPAMSLFKLLEYLPFHPYVAGIVVVICFVLFLTPVGSGTLMIANLSSQGGTSDSDSPVWLRIFWSVTITIVSIGLLLAGSFSAMQSAVVLCGLPFSVILMLYMYGLAKALKQEETHKLHAEAQMTQTRASVQPAKETSSV
ncbi:BCCT family transporter [Acinetobacter sp. ACZLY 512]|uniref:BCCT family transporter n=1 Tax=Acinetobacter sp. ACZLY 512 TaxID=2911206 RepID=UPI0020261C5B|nr:BCCT family transporter [Acinetobacter sp. ACZLY 512]MCL9677041.1 BCCT family transporter [Acinetobacter sp. ACZLY 512]